MWCVLMTIADCVMRNMGFSVEYRISPADYENRGKECKCKGDRKGKTEREEHAELDGHV